MYLIGEPRGRFEGPGVGVCGVDGITSLELRAGGISWDCINLEPLTKGISGDRGAASSPGMSLVKQ